MDKRFRNTLLLVLIFAGLFAYFWYKEKDKTPPSEMEVNENQLETVDVVKINTDDLTEVVVSTASSSSTMRKSDSDWKLTDLTIKTDTERSKNFISQAASIQGVRKYNKNELVEANTGLNKPKYTITYKEKSGNEQMVDIGNITVDGDYYYVNKKGSDTITLVPVYTVEELTKSPEYYRYVPTPSPESSTSPQP